MVPNRVVCPEWLTQRPARLVLARPDFYVFGTGTDVDAPRLVGALRSVLDPIRHDQHEDVLTP